MWRAAGAGPGGASLYDRFVTILLAPFIGSFLGVLIARLPEERSVVVARSACETCRHPLGPLDLVPIVSYLAARGRCRHCGAPIGRFHLAVELVALVPAIWAATLDDGLRLWADCILGWALLALSWIDWRHMILPDALTLPLLLAGLGAAQLLDPGNIFDYAIGAALGFLLFRAVAWAYRAARGRDGLGEGDAKLLAAAGAWVTWLGLAQVMLIAALTGIVVAVAGRLAGKKVEAQTAIPFGPCLAFGTWLVWLYGPLAFG
jgi:leader peptidase (prepilin peptidase) / N-methyltransferase